MQYPTKIKLKLSLLCEFYETRLGPGSAVGEKGKKPGQIGKISVSEESRAPPFLLPACRRLLQLTINNFASIITTSKRLRKMNVDGAQLQMIYIFLSGPHKNNSTTSARRQPFLLPRLPHGSLCSPLLFSRTPIFLLFPTTQSLAWGYKKQEFTVI